MTKTFFKKNLRASTGTSDVYIEALGRLVRQETLLLTHIRQSSNCAPFSAHEKDICAPGRQRAARRSAQTLVTYVSERQKTESALDVRSSIFTIRPRIKSRFFIHFQIAERSPSTPTFFFYLGTGFSMGGEEGGEGGTGLSERELMGWITQTTLK